MAVTSSVTVEMQKLTLRQIMEVEQLLGKSMAKAFTDLDAKGLATFAFVVARKDDPDLTLDEVLDWPVSAITVLDGTEAEADPKAPLTIAAG